MNGPIWKQVDVILLAKAVLENLFLEEKFSSYTDLPMVFVKVKTSQDDLENSKPDFSKTLCSFQSFVHCEIQNHRKVWVRSDLQGHQVQPSTTTTLPTTNPHPHVPIPLGFEHFQAWGLNTCLDSLFQCWNHPVHERILPKIQSKPPLVQPEAVCSPSITCYLRKELDSTSAEPPFRKLFLFIGNTSF